MSAVKADSRFWMARGGVAVTLARLAQAEVEASGGAGESWCQSKTTFFSLSLMLAAKKLECFSEVKFSGYSDNDGVRLEPCAQREPP